MTVLMRVHTIWRSSALGVLLLSGAANVSVEPFVTPERNGAALSLRF